ncbi:MAG: BON domain-containing protein [gamma proteobacterium symbiont of Bathyaustriella thionipta]|nr:BON domain-containing protein [gamma proteobacterium symbiont of Bathyaustriella thionipta]MCU7949396.1 BON domain-containing protein [gamma proteobacterium symbiont of Bathyaustriella thionipta]MCU7953601.1 BON domain-containing protein [gamma proteobacterium symbiont of Bathyaustriella thionipta]MCU7956250.1 BON domain-containing protein [gamma proteobacterium symbiont of Bathyaustriella thionipta]MCU7966578.1 BON domain-containing protein [gamma proteobacterium symbiont of Bathyaustriella
MKNTSIAVTSLMAGVFLTMSACSTVRDTTDWIPGVDSNEEIKAEEQKKMRAAIERERELYADKNAFAPISRTASEADARISVQISQKYTAEAINSEDVGIEVNAGVVTLTGNVSSDDSAVSVISIAKNTQGVSRVISKLVVIKVRAQE